MKRLIFIRHAEADPAANDIDRSISTLGIVQAQHRAKTLEGYSFDLVIVTTAKRTEQTASVICEHLQIHPKKVAIKELYLSPQQANKTVDEIYQKIEEALSKSNPQTVLIVAHANIINELGIKYAPQYIELLHKSFRATEGFEIENEKITHYFLN